MLRNEIEQWQVDAVIEAYHSFLIKGISIDMLKLAHKKSLLGYGDCKKIIQNYIKETYNEYNEIYQKVVS